MIHLYFWPTPNGQKISIALEEMELDWTLVPVDIGAGAQRDATFRAISPNGRIPAIVDHDGPDGKSVTVFESGAILQYLGRKTSRFYPDETRGRIAVDEWLFWQMAGLGPMTGQLGWFARFAKEAIPVAIERYDAEVARLHVVLDARLAAAEFIAGDYSIADMACWPWIHSAVMMMGRDLSALPHLARWYTQVGARPAVIAGAATGMHLRPPPPSGVR
jgi:GSH-dependent disulfide-bond oxidoreductase